MTLMNRGRLLASGILLAILGGVGSVVFFFQPWRVCDYEDTSVGCAVVAADAAGMLICVGVALVGVALAVAGAVSKVKTATVDGGQRRAR